MADKKPSKTNVFDDGKLEKSETPIDFLYRTGITTQIKDVMRLLIDSRPEDPIAFLAEYFDNLADISTALIRAHQKICLVPYSRPAFYDNLMDAYDLLRNQKGGNGLRGLTGKTYNDMLTLLNRDIPTNEAELLMKRIMCYDHEVVRFHVFRSGILSSLIYEEFLKQAESLYQELDLYERGKADKRLCDLCLKKLEDAVNTSNISDPLSIIQAGVHVSSKSFEKTALEVLAKGDHSKETIAKEDFIKSARDIFLNQMPSFK